MELKEAMEICEGIRDNATLRKNQYEALSVLIAHVEKAEEMLADVDTIHLKDGGEIWDAGGGQPGMWMNLPLGQVHNSAAEAYESLQATTEGKANAE